MHRSWITLREHAFGERVGTTCSGQTADQAAEQCYCSSFMEQLACRGLWSRYKARGDPCVLAVKQQRGPSRVSVWKLDRHSPNLLRFVHTCASFKQSFPPMAQAKLEHVAGWSPTSGERQDCPGDVAGAAFHLRSVPKRRRVYTARIRGAKDVAAFLVHQN